NVRRTPRNSARRGFTSCGRPVILKNQTVRSGTCTCPAAAERSFGAAYCSIPSTRLQPASPDNRQPVTTSHATRTVCVFQIFKGDALKRDRECSIMIRSTSREQVGAGFINVHCGQRKSSEIRWQESEAGGQGPQRTSACS